MKTDMKHLSGETLLLMRVLQGESVRRQIDRELDRRSLLGRENEHLTVEPRRKAVRQAA